MEEVIALAMACPHHLALEGQVEHHDLVHQVNVLGPKSP